MFFFSFFHLTNAAQIFLIQIFLRAKQDQYEYVSAHSWLFALELIPVRIGGNQWR